MKNHWESKSSFANIYLFFTLVFCFPFFWGVTSERMKLLHSGCDCGWHVAYQAVCMACFEHCADRARCYVISFFITFIYNILFEHDIILFTNPTYDLRMWYIPRDV